MTTTERRYITFGEREALVAAMNAAGDEGFFMIAERAGITDWRRTWEAFVTMQWSLRCLACGRWTPLEQMTKERDICTRCLQIGT